MGKKDMELSTEQEDFSNHQNCTQMRQASSRSNKLPTTGSEQGMPGWHPTETFQEEGPTLGDRVSQKTSKVLFNSQIRGTQKIQFSEVK